MLGTGNSRRSVAMTGDGLSIGFSGDSSNHCGLVSDSRPHFFDTHADDHIASHINFGHVGNR